LSSLQIFTVYFLRLKILNDRTHGKNSVLRGIFGPKENKVIGSSRKLHNEELHNFYSSPNKIRIIK
jgi:hypothetical protein